MNGVPDEREAFASFLLRLRGKGIVARNLISAFEATPRRAFVPDRWQNVAWTEGMIPIECGEAVEGPDLQAEIMASLAIEPGHRVLEVGTGSGFSAAVMARLAARVVTVERYKTLSELARQRFEALGLTNAFVRHADGSQGLAAEGPFDRIVVWAAFDSMPRSFAEQLSSAGVMISPIGPDEGLQTLTKLTKIGSRFEREDIGTVRLQPIVRSVAAVI
ncbi:protein-L-isoaspartate(D-aspartate) O-methyltransferase [Mesorhizobium sp. KR9-304]|uniref:protein-L-isoaspartate(D-aspartate) O-methyltransferase n=1 Tax=Mesorhizobium sp. KR9-304 TaxID=3156614 RepID=UPI0032B43207